MTNERQERMEQLEAAAAALREFERRRRHDPELSREQFLREHEAVRDLLEPMLEETTDSAAPVGDTAPACPPADAPAPIVGRILGGEHRIVKEIGRGGMGVVYEATQISLDRPVALKVLPAHLTLHDEAVARFKREAATAARLEHAGIVKVHGVGSDGDTHWFTMDLVDGAPLNEIIEDLRAVELGSATGQTFQAAVRDWCAAHERVAGTKTSSHGSSTRHFRDPWAGGHVETIVRLALQVAEALAHAASQGVIHRDVKPANVLVREDGRTVLTDFGLAKGQGLPSLTTTGAFAGTPSYVSPEQAAPGERPVDARADVFSLGVTLYELLTLRLPFEGNTASEVLGKIASKEPTDPQKLNPDVPSDLAAVVLRALEKEPDRRYQSADEFAADLRAFLEYRPVQARRSGISRRLSRWARREPLKAAFGATVIASAFVMSWLGGYIQAKAGVIELGESAMAEIESLRDQTESEPEDPNSWSNLAFALERSGKHAASIEVRRELLKVHPTHARSHFEIGNYERRKGRFKAAIPHLRAALKHGYDAASVYSHLGASLLNLRRMEEALEVFKAQLTASPDDARSMYNLGEILWRLGDDRGAVELFERALRVQPTFPKVYFNLSMRLATMWRAEEAQPHLHKAKEQRFEPPDGRMAARFTWLEQRAAQERRWSELLEKGERATSKSHATLEFAWFAYHRDRYDIALACYRDALDASDDKRKMAGDSWRAACAALRVAASTSDEQRQRQLRKEALGYTNRYLDMIAKDMNPHPGPRIPPSHIRDATLRVRYEPAFRVVQGDALARLGEKERTAWTAVSERIDKLLATPFRTYAETQKSGK